MDLEGLLMTENDLACALFYLSSTFKMENNGIYENGHENLFEALSEENGRGKGNNNGWQTVSYPKRTRKSAKEANSADLDKTKSNGDGNSKVFVGLEQHAEERRKRADAQRAAAMVDSVGETNGKIAASDDDSEGEAVNRKDTANGAVNGDEKKPKQKKEKKNKVTVAEAAAKIDSSHLADFLAEITGQDKLPMIVWAIAQASHGDLVVGMSLWVQNLLPLAVGKTSNPLTRDLTLQLIESIILKDMRKARPILINGATRKGERLVPPSALNLLMQAAFPPDSARTKEKLHIEHIKESTIVLEKLNTGWKNNVASISPLNDLRQTLSYLRLKHKHALENGTGDARLQASVNAADKYCKIILGRFSHKSACLKVTAIVTVLLAVCIMLAIQSGEWKEVALMFSGSSSIHNF